MTRIRPTPSFDPPTHTEVATSVGVRRVIFNAVEQAAIDDYFKDLEAEQTSSNGTHVNENTPQPPRLTLRTMSELRTMPAAEVNWIVERFLAEGGITELSAWIKTGKSTLMAQMIGCVLQDKPFLGLFGVTAGPVVLLTEERPGSLLSALEAVGVRDDDNLHIAMWFEQSGLSWEDAVAQALEFAHELGARALVVDTLGRWAGVDDEQDAAKADRAMAPLQRGCNGLSVAVVRQGRKTGGEVQNAGRGSSAYGGAADILLSLQHHRNEGATRGATVEEDNPHRWLTVVSRYERDVIPRMQLVYQDGLYHAVQATEIVDGSACDQVLADLTINGPSRPIAIAQRTALKAVTVRSALNRLKRRGQVLVHEDLYVLGGLQWALHPDVAAPLRGAVATAGDRGGCNAGDAGPEPSSVAGCRLAGEKPLPTCAVHLRTLDAEGRCPVSGLEVRKA